MADIISNKARFTGDNNAKVVKFSTDDNNVGDEDFKEKLNKHRKKTIIICLLIVLLIIISAVVLCYVMDGITYSTYTIVSSVHRDDSESAKYSVYCDGYIRYSNDGIAFHNKYGEVIWDRTYSMQMPQIKICGETVAVGDINGSTVNVFDKTGSLGSIDTSMTISQIEVAKQGVVAAVLEDNDANYINLYNYNGDKIYSVKTSLSGDGYPIDISISDDGTKLIASYLYVSGEKIKTNVVFYNFSDVGQNETQRIVGGFNHYNDTIVGDVKFFGNNTAVAVSENVISIYNIKEYPNLAKEIPIENEIQKVIFSGNYIGVLLNNSDTGDIFKLVVYDTDGKLVSQVSFNTQYDNIILDNKTIVMNTDTILCLVNFSGKVLAEIEMNLPIDDILPHNGRGNYICINSKYVQNIHLK